MLRFLPLTFLLLPCVAAPADAQHCRTHATVRVGGYATYAAPVKVAVRYQTYHKARIVAFEVPTYYYGVADGYNASLIADAAAYRALKLQVQQQQAAYAAAAPPPTYHQQQAYQPVPQAAPAPVPQAVPDCPDCEAQPQVGNPIQIVPQTPAPAYPQAQPKAASNWKAQLAGVVQSACANCHNPQQADGGVDLSNLQAVPFMVRVNSYRSVVKGHMPKNGSKLSAAQVRLFQLWLQSR